MKEIKAFNPMGENGIFIETGKHSVIVTGINVYSGEAVEYMIKGIKSLTDARRFVEFYTCGTIKVKYLFG